MPAKPQAAKAARTTPRAESLEKKQERALLVVKQLRKEFPEARTALHHASPFELLIATILSAQCTDERVNMVTPVLFQRYKSVAELAVANQPELEVIIRSTGFFHMKSKNIIACCTALMERFGGTVPAMLDELVTLPGVGRKTANVVLGQAFGITSGVVVDTHVHRLARRMGFSKQDTPEKIEQDLMTVFPKRTWIEISNLLILHGRRTCPARKPQCDLCKIEAICPQIL